MVSRHSEELQVPGLRRPAIVVEAERRQLERRARLGTEIQGMRRRRRWAQAELGRRIGAGRMVIGRLERGQGHLDLEILERIGIAFGVPLAVGFDRDVQQDVADAGHLGMQELVLRVTRGHGWTRQFEMPTRPSDPWRSSDVGLGDEQRRTAIDAECWNTFGDLGAATRSSRRKVAELEQLALARWGEGAQARLVWIVRETARNRALVNRYPEVFASTFTGSSRAWVAALTTGSEPPDEPGLVWCDLATGRLHAWNRPRPSAPEPRAAAVRARAAPTGSES
jgi:transcriptional regulator with XRE-family HTH domain